MALRAALVGIGGYGRTLLEVLAAAQAEQRCALTAAVVRTPGRYPESERLLGELGARAYPTLEELLAAEAGRLELVVVAGGIPCHATASIAALEAGCHVLCEKPAAGTLAQARRMQQAAERSGLILAVGYQGMFGPSVGRLKTLCTTGELGALTRARALITAPRGARYYRRRDWGGRRGGAAVLDSPIQNACAHHLQHMLYVAGAGERRSATPAAVTAEHYRAARDAWADTQYLRVETREGAVIGMLAAHACLDSIDLRAEYRFERGSATSAGGRVVIEWAGNREEVADPPDAASLPLRAVLAAIRSGEPPACTIGNALQHTACIEAGFAAAPPAEVPAGCVLTATPPPSLPADAAGTVTAIRGIEPTVLAAHAAATGYAGVEAPWALPPGRVSLREDLTAIRQPQPRADGAAPSSSRSVM